MMRGLCITLESSQGALNAAEKDTGCSLKQEHDDQIGVLRKCLWLKSYHGSGDSEIGNSQRQDY